MYMHSLSAVVLPRSRKKAYNTAESRPCTQIAIVSSVRLNIWQNTRSDITAHGGNMEFSECREIKHMRKQ